MLDPEPLHGQREPVGVFLGGELGGVDADDLELVRKGFVQAVQIGQDVDAIDAAGGPKIEQHDLATQVREAERQAADPIETRRKFGSADRAGIESGIAFQFGTSELPGQRTIQTKVRPASAEDAAHASHQSIRGNPNGNANRQISFVSGWPRRAATGR